MIKVVILDLDDTLVLTREMSFEADNEVLRRLGFPPVSKAVHNKHWGKPAEEAVTYWAPGVDLRKFEEVYTRAIAEYVQAGRFDTIPTENLQVLDTLLARGKELFILTSRRHHEMVHLLESDHQLAHRIHTFYYKDIMKFHKPDPRAFQQIKDEHGFRADECVYVGDSVIDAMAAKGAGLHFIASLEAGLRTKRDFKDYQVDVFIINFKELAEAVKYLDNDLLSSRDSNQ